MTPDLYVISCRPQEGDPYRCLDWTHGELGHLPLVNRSTLGPRCPSRPGDISLSTQVNGFTFSLELYLGMDR